MNDRVLLRQTFDEEPELYDRLRPAPPAAVLDDLVELAHLRPGARLLEIGCGTGQATLPLAERGFTIVGIELGERLAELAKRKLAHFGAVKIVCAPFEDWSARTDERFDCVVGFNSFHWIDPEHRFARPAALLADGGALGVVGMHFLEHDDADELWLALQEDYEAVAGVPEPRVRPEEVRDRSAEFETSGFFGDVRMRRYQWDVSYSADDYVALLETTSWHRRLDADVRERLLERIHRRISARAGATISPTRGAVLYVATRGG